MLCLERLQASKISGTAEVEEVAVKSSAFKRWQLLRVIAHSHPVKALEATEAASHMEKNIEACYLQLIQEGEVHGLLDRSSWNWLLLACHARSMMSSIRPSANPIPKRRSVSQHKPQCLLPIRSKT